MKTILEYQCEICRSRYHTVEVALACEAKGQFDLSKFVVGLMFEYHHNGYIGIFSIPPDTVKPYGRDGHMGTMSWWACRVSAQYGDSLGDEKCGGGGFYYSHPAGIENFKEWHKITEAYVGCTEFKRMVKWLKSQKIVPSYYNESGDLITIK